MTPYERAWRRAQRTGKPSLYRRGGWWFVAYVPNDEPLAANFEAWEWAYTR